MSNLYRPVAEPHYEIFRKEGVHLKTWKLSLECLVVRLVLEFWRHRMIRTQNNVLRLRYSQICDHYILRYHAIKRRQKQKTFPQVRNCS